MRQLAARLLRLYPRWWRDRYEAEVGGLLEEHQVRLTTLVDPVAGAVDARLNPTYRQEEPMAGSTQEAVEREVAVDPDEVSREEIRAELRVRQAKLQASADDAEDRKKAKWNSPLNPAEEAALGPALLYNPAIGG
jgi:hypothetical protein